MGNTFFLCLFIWCNAIAIFIISLHFWFKDLIREFYKKYEVLLMILFLAYLIFLVSEGLLFISFFWGTFHSLSSPNRVPDSVCSLTCSLDSRVVKINLSSFHLLRGV